MARQIKERDIISKIKQAGRSGAPANPAEFARKFRLDVDPRQLGVLLEDLCARQRIKRVVTDHGGRKRFRLFA